MLPAQCRSSGEGNGSDSLHLLVNRVPFALKAGNRSGHAMLVRAAIKHAISRAKEWVPLLTWFSGKNGGLCEEQLGFLILNVNHIQHKIGRHETLVSH